MRFVIATSRLVGRSVGRSLIRFVRLLTYLLARVFCMEFMTATQNLVQSWATFVAYSLQQQTTAATAAEAAVSASDSYSLLTSYMYKCIYTHVHRAIRMYALWARDSHTGLRHSDFCVLHSLYYDNIPHLIPLGGSVGLSTSSNRPPYALPTLFFHNSYFMKAADEQPKKNPGKKLSTKRISNFVLILRSRRTYTAHSQTNEVRGKGDRRKIQRVKQI